jgi:hypothetical protein
MTRRSITVLVLIAASLGLGATSASATTASGRPVACVALHPVLGYCQSNPLPDVHDTLP